MSTDGLAVLSLARTTPRFTSPPPVAGPSLALVELLEWRAGLESESPDLALHHGAVTRLAAATRAEGSFSLAVAGLGEADRRIFRAWLGADWEALQNLTAETDASLFAEALLELGHRGLNSADPANGLAILAWLRDGNSSFPLPPFAADRAAQELDAALGSGSFGRRWEFLSRRFAQEAANPYSLAAMTAGQWVFSSVRLGVLGRLAASPSANFLTRGAGARIFASAAALGPELATFWGTDRLLRQAFASETPRWDAGTLRREWASLALTLGLLKLGGTGSQALFRRWHGLEESALVSSRLSGATRFSQAAFQQAGLLAGIGLARYLEPRFGLRRETPADHPILDSLATLAHLNVGGRLAGRLLGPAHEARAQALGRSLELPNIPRAGASVFAALRSPQALSPAYAGAGELLLPGRSFSVQSSVSEDRLEMSPHPVDPAETRGTHLTGSPRPGTAERVESDREPPLDPELERSLEPLLRGLRAAVDDESLHAIFTRLRLDPELLLRHAWFAPQNYARRPLFREGEGADSFEVLLLGWEDGQGTVPHDHGGSTGFDLVVSGAGVETPFRLDAQGRLEALPSQELRPGDVSAIRAADIHVVANRQGGGRRLVTLHAYRPIMDPQRIRKFPVPETQTAFQGEPRQE